MTKTTDTVLSSSRTLCKVSNKKVKTWNRTEYAMLLFQFTMQKLMSNPDSEQARAFMGFRKWVRDMGGFQKVYEFINKKKQKITKNN